MDENESDEPSFRERARYRLDNLLARGTVATLVSLGVVAGSAVLVSSLVLTISGVTFAGSDDGRWLEDLWQSMLRVLDPGTMAGDVGWGRRLLALVVTVFGLLVAGTLIGIIANGVEDRVDSMRRGRSTVIESGHIVVVGGTDRLPMVIRQLALMNRSQPRTTIVVLADRDPGELHEDVRVHLSGIKGVNVVYRSGDPTRRTDLEIVRPGSSRGIVVLADGVSDSTAVKTVLAITADLDERQHVPVVVELADPRTAALLIETFPGVEPIVPLEAMGRIAAFALRQRGLSQVVLDLTDAGSSSIYLVERPEVIGLSFRAIVGRFENAIPIGRFGADASIELNPSPDRELLNGDRLIVISSGDEPRDRSDAGSNRAAWAPSSAPIAIDVQHEHLAIVGWNALGSQLLEGWAVSASPESTVEILYDSQVEDAAEVRAPDIGVPVRITPVSQRSAVVSDPRTTTVIVLGGHSDDITATDARTIVNVRALQRLVRASAGPSPRFVVELRDPDNSELLDLDGPDDFIVSTAFAAQLAVQLVGQPERRRILLQMYSADGPSLRLITSDRIGVIGECTFSDIVDAAYRAGVIAIGWRASTASGVQLVLGPPASSRVSLLPDDEVIVVA